MATLEELREATGMTQRPLAAKLAVPPTQIAALCPDRGHG